MPTITEGNQIRKNAQADGEAVYEESCGIVRDIAGHFTRPVAGPFVFTIMWLLSVLGVVAYFAWLVSASAATWGTPITEFKQVLAGTGDDGKPPAMAFHEYPDIYMCLPGEFAKDYLTKEGATDPDKYLISAGVDEATYTAVQGMESCGAQRTAAFLKVDPLSRKIAAADGCPVKEITKSKTGGTEVQLGCWKEHVAAAEGVPEANVNECKTSVELPVDESMQWADGLAELMPKAEDGTKALCLRHAAHSSAHVGAR